MKVHTTVLGVTGIQVQPGSTPNTGKHVREIVILTEDGDVVVRLMAEHREDLQITFADNDQGGWKAAVKKNPQPES
jgi:hypothetical protein